MACSSGTWAAWCRGSIEKALFDRLTGEAGATWNIWPLFALFVSVELGRVVANGVQDIGQATFFCTSGKRLRHNLLASIFRRPGALRLPLSAGETLSRLDEDVNEVADFPLWLPYVAAPLLAAAIALGIMARIHLAITLVVLLPLGAVVDHQPRGLGAAAAPTDARRASPATT